MYSVTVAALYTVLPCVIAVTMTIMYRAAKKNETKLSKYGVGALRANIMDNPPKDTIDKTRQKTGMACWGGCTCF